MEFDEIWAYSIDRISDYLAGCSAEEDVAGTCEVVKNYVLDGVHIQLYSMPKRKVGQLSFPQTRVVMKPESNMKSDKKSDMIPDENVERVHYAFYLNFLSGGA